VSLDLAGEQTLALSAIHEVTKPDTVGAFRDRVASDDGTVTLTFHSTMAGYPGWLWHVALAEVEGDAPTVLELELLPHDGSLIAPDWVPWSQRLAEYKEAQRLAREAGEITEEDEPVIVPDSEDFDGDLGLVGLDEDDESDDDDDEDDDDSDDESDDDDDDDDDNDDDDDDEDEDDSDDESDDEEDSEEDSDDEDER
jgi:hypothetical protein